MDSFSRETTLSNQALESQVSAFFNFVNKNYLYRPRGGNRGSRGSFSKRNSISDASEKLKGFLTHDRGKRPSGYMNQAPLRDAYLRNYLPWHFPELFWIFSVTNNLGEGRVFKEIQTWLTHKESIEVFDLGSGPATASLSFLFWLKSQGLTQEAQQNIHFSLWDQSSQITEIGQTFLNFCLNAKIGDSIPTPEGSSLEFKNSQVRRINAPLKGDFATHLRHLKLSNKIGEGTARFVFISHALNEFGSGPRFRNLKLGLIHELSARLMHPDGSYLVLIEPPLREPTLDLMWIRDQLSATHSRSGEEIPLELEAVTEEMESDDFNETTDFGDTDLPPQKNLEILAPCPQGQKKCPMALRRAGWCYAQPPRAWAKAKGLAPVDGPETHDLMGFSYLVLRKSNTEGLVTDATRVGVSDDSQTRSLWCEKDKLTAKFHEKFYRGEIRKKPIKKK